MDAQHWDRRYAGSQLVWGVAPNQWVEAVCVDLPPGRALDLACGEGRNTLWLASRGWHATGVDFSQVALDRAAQLGTDLPAGSVRWVRADLLNYRPDPAAFDLVILVYLQLPADQRAAVVRSAAAAVAPGGTLVVVAHDSANLAEGFGGPQDPRVLYTAQDVVADLEGARLPLRVDRAERVRRVVRTPEGERVALDVLVTARREH